MEMWFGISRSTGFTSKEFKHHPRAGRLRVPVPHRVLFTESKKATSLKAMDGRPSFIYNPITKRGHTHI